MDEVWKYGRKEKIYLMFCTDIGIDKTIGGFDILGRFKAEFSLLKKQYDARSTENFEKAYR